MGDKTYLDELAEIRKHSKLLYKSFTENETGQVYQLVMLSLEYGSGTLLATMALSSHTAYKRSIPIRALNATFTPYDPHKDREEKENAVSTTA